MNDDDINLQEVADFLNTQARHGRMLAKAEEVAKAVLQSGQRIQEVEAVLARTRAEAAKVEAAAALVRG